MHGKVLIIDPIATNRIILKVKFSAAYYTVSQALTLAEAIAAIESSRPDIVITADQLPDGTALDLVTRIREQPEAQNIPIIAINCGDDANNHLSLLEAGIDVVLTKPFDDTLLLARVRSLVRSSSVEADWNLREGTSRALGFAEIQKTFVPTGRAVLVGPDRDLLDNWTSQMAGYLSAHTKVADVDEALYIFGTSQNTNIPDVFALVMDETDPQKILHFLATLKSNASTRHCAVLMVQIHPDQALGAQALDMGANDLMPYGFQPAEMALRINALLRRKKSSDKLRAKIRDGLEAAVSDPLTGLHNRRYAMSQLDRIAEQSVQTGEPFTVMIADMDHFKRINDTHGHAAGDVVLIETANRLRTNLRSVDLLARIGGEEFLIVMPGVPLQDAKGAARRLCHLIGQKSFKKPDGLHTINATISIGLAIGCGHEKTTHRLLDEADKALYAAKTRGRNCVTLSRPAA